MQCDQDPVPLIQCELELCGYTCGQRDRACRVLPESIVSYLDTTYASMVSQLTMSVELVFSSLRLSVVSNCDAEICVAGNPATRISKGN